MVRYFKERKERKERKEKEREEKYLHRKAKREKAVEEATIKMLNSPCAINNMEKCDKSCVHFKAGQVSSWELYDDIIVEFNYPKCRLWK